MLKERSGGSRHGSDSKLRSHWQGHPRSTDGGSDAQTDNGISLTPRSSRLDTGRPRSPSSSRGDASETLSPRSSHIGSISHNLSSQIGGVQNPDPPMYKGYSQQSDLSRGVASPTKSLPASEYSGITLSVPEPDRSVVDSTPQEQLATSIGNLRLADRANISRNNLVVEAETVIGSDLTSDMTSDYDGEDNDFPFDDSDSDGPPSD